MTWILGISAFYHDASVALLRDGAVCFAASEESFSRKKHDAGFPAMALQAALRFADISTSDLDYVGFYEKPLLKFERLLETYLAYAPAGYASFAAAVPSWLQVKLHIPREIKKHLGGDYKKRIVFCEHHESHAASAFFPSPFDEAAVLTVDGVGEWATSTWGIGRGNEIELRGEMRFPHSLGLLYSAFTYFCGFRVNSGEYKLMGLAPYGEPTYYDLLMKELVEVHADGSFRLNMGYFGFGHTLRMTHRRLEQLLGFPRRKPDEELRTEDKNLAASVQKVTEEILLRMCQHVHQSTRSKNLVLAGGVGLNCVANARLLRESPFEQIWVQPAAGDSGGALGIAWFIWHQLLGQPRSVQQPDAQQALLLGVPAPEEGELQQLREQGAVMQDFADGSDLDKRVAKLLANGKVVGWVQGRMEFGPRALGNRSILADPRNPTMQAILNAKIKNREAFRPFAPAVMEERAGEFFEFEHGQASPYMLFTASVREEHAAGGTGMLPAVTHVDNSARVQTVNEHQSPRFHSLLKSFEALTGCPVLINTSFNIRGEPMVRTAKHAYRCFLATEMDALVVGDSLMLRADQPAALIESSKAYLADLELD